MLNEGAQFKNKSNNENWTFKILKEKIKSVFREMYRLPEEKDAKKLGNILKIIFQISF
jgi:hypothetical protein